MSHPHLYVLYAGKKFGEAKDPLLVSVRSGAAVSMPGMMDTVLNLGLNDQVSEHLTDLAPSFVAR
jgi:pyruvate,orthophosphate dikinase